MFSFPSEERGERERERERDRETYELASVSLSFFLRSLFLARFFFFLARAALVLNFEWTKRGRMLPLPCTFLFSLWTSFGTFKSFTTGSFSIASSFVLFFISLPFVLKKKKKKNSKHERLTFFIAWSVDRYRSVDRSRGRARYSGPLCGIITVQKRCEKIALWTAIGPWTAIGDGPLTGYFIYTGKKKKKNVPWCISRILSRLLLVVSIEKNYTNSHKKFFFVAVGVIVFQRPLS